MRIRQILSLVFVCLLAMPLLLGQAISEDEIKITSQPFVPQLPGAIRVQSTMVDVGVVVRDSHGQPISGLTEEDFEVYDQGKKQEISHFVMELAHPQPAQAEDARTNPAAPPPPPAVVPVRYIGMYFDDQSMPMSDLVFARKAAEAYVHDTMQDNDRAAIFTSSTTLTQQFTSDKQKLLETLAKLLTHQKKVSPGCPQLTPYQAFQIEQFANEHSDPFDLAMAEAKIECFCVNNTECMHLVESQAAVTLSLSEQFAQESLGVLGDVIRYMGKMPGRRTLIMASSGFFSQTPKIQHVQDRMIDDALRADIVVNTLDAKGLAADWVGGNAADGTPLGLTGPLGGYADELASDERSVANDALAAIAEGTGGKFFHNNNDLVGGLRQIAAVPDVSYVLGFAPEDMKDNGAYHGLKVKVPGKTGLSIAARPGYFARTKQQEAPSNKFQRLNKEVMASDTLKEIISTVGIQNGVLATGESALKVSVHVDGRGLLYKNENKRHAERVIFVTALFDMQGHFLTGAEAVMDMTLKDDTRTKITHDGVDEKLTLQAPPGSYRLREVVQEVVGGRTSTLTQPVQIQ